MAKHVLKTEPAQEQVTLEVARLHLRLDEDLEGSPAGHPDDELIEILISAAREQAESYTGLSLVNREHELNIDSFKGSYIDLEVWPVSAITEVTYFDSDGVEQIWANDQYRLDNATRPARLYPAVNNWPKTKVRENAVKVTFDAGFTDSEGAFPCPKVLLQAMLLIIGHLYENRQDVIASGRSGGQLELPMGSIFLMTPHRINMVV
jgi:uncharacterized phiE125 gp8 family phage protein